MERRKTVINLLIVALSAAFGALLCEVGSRFFLNSADYLAVQLVDHKILGKALPPKASGYDEWGFRNRRVPPTVDIVAIGDSHTFGNTAKMDESWPYVLGRLTGKTVYNLSMGGYGPNQYYYLFNTRALELKPRVIICGLYMGDDLDNAFRITYGLDYWSFLRTLPFEKVNADIWEVPDKSSWHNGPRIWLSSHSVVYQIAFHTSLLGRLNGRVQIENASRFYDAATSLIIRDRNIAEAFVPRGPLRGLDQEKQSVKEGLRITLTLLEKMNQMSFERQIGFIVVVIPTKEMVFAEYLERASNLKLADVVHELISNERIARDKIFNFFRESNIRYIDVLPALRGAVGSEIYARSGRDMHPSKNGYKVIAEAIADFMKGEDVGNPARIQSVPGKF